MDWTQFATFMIVNIVFTLTLWLWNWSESREDMRTMLGLISAIQAEMKDFHGKLAAIDAEFKGKMALIDAEFKNHFIYGHPKDQKEDKK